MIKYILKIATYISTVSWKKAPLLLIVVTILIGFGTYIYWNTTSTNTFKLNEGIAHFQFDYPADYQISHIIVADYIDVLMSRTITGFTSTLWLSINDHVYISAYKRDGFTSIDSNDYDRIMSTEIDKAIRFASSSKGFSLISRDILLVDNISAYQYKYTSTSVPESENPDDYFVGIRTIFTYEAYFWDIVIASDKQDADALGKTLNQIISTFKFLIPENDDEKEYKSFILPTGNYKVSFEYPQEFRLDAYQVDEVKTIVPLGIYMGDSSFTGETLVDRYSPGGGRNIAGTMVEIEVWEPGEYPGINAADKLTKDIQYYSVPSKSKVNDFFVISREPVRISGCRGELVVFSYKDRTKRIYSWYPVLYDSIDGDVEVLDIPLQTIDKRAYFNYRGFIWTITMKSSPDLYDRDEKWFNHIIDTIRVGN